ncbi:MAG: hypothetical protein PHV23_02640 [Candidatus Gracilibacteria bacterium]|nr:hypothetical protein [Candidatus Gracilibacteria bacterium]
MLKKIIIISTFILLLFGINFPSLKSYYYNKTGEKYFMQNDLNTALKYFSLANDDFGKYNEGNISYVNKDFSGAINNYESILDTKEADLLFNANHNLGNSYYRIGEKLEGENQKKFYENSVNYYSSALNIKDDIETRANLEFVLNKLKEQEKKEDKSDEKSSSGSQDNTGSGSENNSGSGTQNNSTGLGSQNNETSGQDSSSTGSGSQSSSGSGTQNASSENAGNNSKSGDSAEALSAEQLKAISDYKEALKKEQDYNSEGFNKVYQGDGNGDIFDSFFNNSLLNQDNKKDW